MAINVDTQDLENFPGNVKRVTADQVSVVPVNFEGDEQYVMKFTTSAYSDIENRTSIQDYYVTYFKSGWVKSSGFQGSSIALSATVNKLLIKLDSTVSGTDGSGYYEVVLDHNDGIPLSAETVAADLETKIRALADNLNTADVGYISAYRNSSVEYKDGKFWIVSGTVSNFYNGTNKSYVDVDAPLTNSAAAVLGFDLKTNSATFDSVSINEALVVSSYTVSGTTLTVDQTLGAHTNDCLMITDIDNTDYFQLTEEPTDGGTSLTFSSAVIANSYTADEAKVQLLREQDPEADPISWFNDVDGVIRHGIKSMINQIDFSE